MDGSLPKTIGRYEVVRHLGTGAMGHVYLARDPELDRSVAIKTLRNLDMPADALTTFLDRFRNEARAAARLHHPAIVQVYDVGQDEHVGPYLVFEYVEGATLKTVLRERGPMAASKAVLLAAQIGKAIDVAHSEGIIHRDIKPENVLVTEAGDCKLADFGIARLPDAALTQEGQFLGTPCYAAPETLSRAEYSTKSDLFSFGALLYEVITGSRPFPGDDAVAVAHQVVHDEPPPPSAAMPAGTTTPQAVDACVMSALAKDPNARPTTATALAGQLRKGFEDAGFADTVSANVPGAGMPTGRRRHLGFGLTVAGIAAAGIAVVFSLRNEATRSTDPPGGVGAGPDAGSASRRSDAGRGVVAGGDIRDAGIDAGRADANDGSLDVPRNMTGTRGDDPEEQAKFALERARAAIAAGDIERAIEAVREAQRLDPGNDGIAEITDLLPVR